MAIEGYLVDKRATFMVVGQVSHLPERCHLVEVHQELEEVGVAVRAATLLLRTASPTLVLVEQVVTRGVV